MTYDDIRETQEKFLDYIAAYIKANPRKSYPEIAADLKIPTWKVQTTAVKKGIRRLGGHPGVKLVAADILGTLPKGGK